MYKKIIQHRGEILLTIVILVISAVSHGYNMFGFPYYENDEGTYMSQAWSIVTFGKLAPYTYWYDHAPAGWMLIAIWIYITKTIFLFGFSLNSGRVLMLLVHVISTLLILRIAKKMTGSLLPGVIAALIFSLSPLGLYFQRRILLDNIMIFWVLLSYYLILGKARKLSHIGASGVIMGIAVLTKENAVFFVPAFLYTMYKNMHAHNKRFAIVSWLVVFSCTISVYFLYAILNKELFPYGAMFGGDAPHVSLIGTMRYQASRGGGSLLNFWESSFWINFLLWVRQDAFIMSLGIVSNLLLVAISIIKRNTVYIGYCLLVVLYWVFLMRGGTVIVFYITPIIPLLSLTIGLTLFELCVSLDKLLRTHYKNAVLSILSVVVFFFYMSYNQISRALEQNITGRSIFTSSQTAGQVESVNWIRNNVPSNATIVIDNYSYLDLQSSRNPSGTTYPKAHYYWKIDQDNEVKNILLKNNPESIDYIAKTPQMAGDLLGNVSPLTTQALSNSIMAKSFNSDGWGVEIWATRYPSKILYRSWETYKKIFLKNDRQSFDPNQKNITTSEGQSYAMLRAVWMNDESTFIKIWDWTNKNLKNANGVFSWKWGKNSVSKEMVLDAGSATDADTDIALSLLFTYKRWGDKAHLESAQKLLNSIWKTEVKSFRGSYYILPGNWAKGNSALTINPSYLSPYAYRIFAEADTNHPWATLVDTSYELLEGCMSSPLFTGDTPVFLPPNWCQMEENGTFRAASEPGLGSTEYSYDAVRTMWRLALDYKWYAEPRAKKLLDQSGEFLMNTWSNEGAILVGYTHDGKPWEKYESVLGYATSLSNFSIISPSVADDIYKTKVLNKFYENFDRGQSYWEDPKNYYVQNWAWFGTALYANKLPNVWKGN